MRPLYLRMAVLSFAAAALPLLFLPAVGAQAQARPAAPIAAASLIPLPHSTHPLASAPADRGSAKSSLQMDRMILTLSAGDDREKALREYLDSQQDKSSPQFHHWLTPQEFGDRFGVSESDVQQVSQWLQQQGFSLGHIPRSRRWLEFSGTAGQVASAFHADMHYFEVNGQMHLANATDISLPASLAPLISGVVSLNDFFRQSQVAGVTELQRNAEGALIAVGPEFSSGAGVHYLAPGDIAAIYNLSPLYSAGITGIGATIAIVARSNILISDVETFRTIFNLPVNDPTVILNGPDPGLTGDVTEASLDVEWSGAVAPQATIDIVVSSSTVTTDGVDLSAAYIVDNNLAGVMSTSYGV